LVADGIAGDVGGSFVVKLHYGFNLVRKGK
jgi:hypothetical protein